MSTCPAGHESAAGDYCDVCGLPIEEGGAAEAAATDAPAEAVPAPEPAEEPETCPNCQAASPPNALFCEACGYDFTTGTAPRPMESMLDLDAPAAAGESEVGRPEVPEAPGRPAAPEAPAERVAPALAEEWVAEVWIDPDWYAVQDSTDPLPSAGVPTVLPLRSGSALVGRTSRSRNIHPDIDLSTDNGISRRHCQLTTDGTRWWVEDLGSSNGTFVGSSIGELPDVPLTPGEKREIAPDEAVYLGAWTRIVVRKATPGEI
jgi:hypothetical protein